MSDSPRPRMGEDTRTREESGRSIGQRIRNVLLNLALLAFIVTAVSLAAIAWHLPEILELGWALVEAINGHSESVDQLGGAL